MLVKTNFQGPAVVKIIQMKDGTKRILINGEDVSMMTTGFDIESRPGRLDLLRLEIPIASWEASKEQ